PNIHYADHMIQIDTRHQGSLTPGGSGLILVPLVFTWNDILVPEKDERRCPVIAYSVRGGGLWSHQAEEPSEALIAALGEGRANVLRQLTTPRSTSELAQRLEVTPGNISLHIARLREAGLVESQQLGKWVFHRLTPRGEHLLALFAP
ncbi:MAG: helix-turn-helix domain-containing protein, partial [Anaerolineae bacterium]|nr:helix-turn-helix domain-containing protein [Anaerolineae bacterium]